MTPADDAPSVSRVHAPAEIFADAESDSPASVRWSVRVVDVDTDHTLWEFDPGLVLKTASIGKLFLLIEIARQCEAGELRLDERITRTDEDAVADSGLWQLLSEPSMSIQDLCVLIGSVSDNLATNVLVRRIGIDRVAETTAACGFTVSRLLDRVRDERLPEHPHTLSVGSAGELCRLAADLQRGEIVSPAVSRRVLDWLAGGTDLSMVASALCLDPLAHVEEDRGVLLRNKTGTISTARGDVGVVAGGNRTIAYAVLANWPEPGAGSTDQRDGVLEAMAGLGGWIREIMRPAP